MQNIQSKTLQVLNACDELTNGKFIFAESMIVKLLDVISECEEVYNLIGVCIKNFDFELCFKKAKQNLNVGFKMPEDTKEMIALVFCIFVDIKEQKLNFNEFISTCFVDKECSPFESFSQKMVTPFRDAIAFCFEIEDNKTEKLEEQKQSTEQETNSNNNEMTDKVKSFVEETTFLLESLRNAVQKDKKCKGDFLNDVLYIIDMALEGLKENDYKNASAYLVALEHILKGKKTTKLITNQFKIKLINLYA